MDTHDGDRPLSVEGLPVTSIVDAPATPEVNHGRLAISIGTDARCDAAITSVEIVATGDRLGVDEFFVYTLPEYDEIDPSHLVVTPGSRIEYEVSFAGRPVAPADDPIVEIEVLADGRSYLARSPVTLTVRTRSRQPHRSDGFQDR